MSEIKKLLVANRSEIAIRIFRTAAELGIRTVALYTNEDRYALHRFKADEAYLIGKAGEPIKNYLNIDEIIRIAKKYDVDAIHPGYGFLSENPAFAKACRDNGIIFIGPSNQTLKSLGDKVSARKLALKAGIPVLGGSDNALANLKQAKQYAGEVGYPIILKAAHGGGGRGMRVVNGEEELESAFDVSRRESLNAFGSDEVFIEKFIEKAKHIEVQLLGDQHGNLVHLFERDCSVQRRHQKVIEIAPSPHVSDSLREQICQAAVKIGNQANYANAGTVEFLVDVLADKFYFIEVNPRIQVEHTVTEEVTGIDIVKSQIMVAQGALLSDKTIGINDQGDVLCIGFALQCRVTTEEPENNFMPDYGRITHYRSASGMGIRLDAGSAFSGAIVNPYYDSMLVKVTSRGRLFNDAIKRMQRALREFRIRGVKTNIRFLINLLDHPTFVRGDCTTRFIDTTPGLFELESRQNRASRLLTYIADVIVNENETVKGRELSLRRLPAPLPELDVTQQSPKGTRDVFLELGADEFSKWILKQKRLLITDTTMRDAHQSLLATRMRTDDLRNIAQAYSSLTPDMFSLEMWGGATFDTSMRFLKECPWQRLVDLREKIPNILFQMLLRGSSAVGYSNFPDNVVKAFVDESAQAGIDVFRIFDALNWLPNMKVAIEATRKSGAIAEASICYSGDILDPARTKYDLNYYIKLAKELEKMGANILAIKDMAGLCKPDAIAVLVKALKQEVSIPIHFHTHDTAGIQAASILNASKTKVDIVDAALAPFSGGTSQPNLNTLVESLKFTPRATKLDVDSLDKLADYWRAVREFYKPFESETLPATADLYKHEMPGGQYTNLFQQARALGMADQWQKVCQVYADVNQLFGDIIKVTPSSKVVGDMALYLVANDLSTADVLDPARELAYPSSVVELISGRMGKPYGGFPAKVKKRILKDTKPIKGRPGSTLKPVNFKAQATKVKQITGKQPSHRDVLSYVMYPKVYEDYIDHRKQYADTSCLPTPVYFYGLKRNEEVAIDIETGKTLILKYLAIGNPTADGKRTVFFELNGQPREATVLDRSLVVTQVSHPKADDKDPAQIGSSMPGMVVNVAVKIGDKVKKGQKLLTLEAMKMETLLYAEHDGLIEDVLVKAGSQVQTGDLLVRLKH